MTRLGEFNNSDELMKYLEQNGLLGNVNSVTGENAGVLAEVIGLLTDRMQVDVQMLVNGENDPTIKDRIIVRAEGGNKGLRFDIAVSPTARTSRPFSALIDNYAKVSIYENEIRIGQNRGGYVECIIVPAVKAIAEGRA